jgi:hypothetical protein
VAVPGRARSDDALALRLASRIVLATDLLARLLVHFALPPRRFMGTGPARAQPGREVDDASVAI